MWPFNRRERVLYLREIARNPGGLRDKLLRKVSFFRKEHPPALGWAIRTWVDKNKDGEFIVTVSICNSDDHVIANSVVVFDDLADAECVAIINALDLFCCGMEGYDV